MMFNLLVYIYLILWTINSKFIPHQHHADLLEHTGGNVGVTYSDATHTASFISLPSNARHHSLLSTTNTQEKAIDMFLSSYGGVFGIDKSNKEQLKLKSVKNDPIHSTTFYRYEQVYQGIPVFGSDLRFHFSTFNEQKKGKYDETRLTAVNGFFIPDLNIKDSIPTVDSASAMSIALKYVESKYSSPNKETKFEVQGNSKLLFYRTNVDFDTEGENYLVHDVRVEGHGTDAHVNANVYVDAQTGKIVDMLLEATDFLFQEIYTREEARPFTSDIPVWSTGDELPSDLTWQNMINTTMETYNLIASITNGTYLNPWNSNTSKMIMRLHTCTDMEYLNAYFTGELTDFCKGLAIDDVVAHEWGHAYTQFTSDLVYRNQPGAMNEAFSDIWGETVDILNGRDEIMGRPTGFRHPSGSQCANYSFREGNNFAPDINSSVIDQTTRWLVGEDAPATGGAIRDMWYPECGGDPGKVSSAWYRCSTSDNGGVHSNSGVPNHVFALLTDGGLYNGYDIQGIGIEKATALFWRAGHDYLTMHSNFIVLADSLTSSCLDLLDKQMPIPVTTGPSTWGQMMGGITSDDCDELTKVINACELYFPQPCQTLGQQQGLQTLYPEPAPLILDSTLIFSENFENGLDLWNCIDTSEVSEPRNCSIVNYTTGDGIVGHDSVYLSDVECEDGCFLNLRSPEIIVPNFNESLILSLIHSFNFEANYDGGYVSILNNGSRIELIKSDFLYNGYNDQVSGYPDWKIFSGDASNAWYQSLAELPFGSVWPGDNITIEFSVYSDDMITVDGWYLDKIELVDGWIMGDTNYCARLNRNPLNRHISGRICGSCFDGYVNSSISRTCAFDLGFIPPEGLIVTQKLINFPEPEVFAFSTVPPNGFLLELYTPFERDMKINLAHDGEVIDTASQNAFPIHSNYNGSYIIQFIADQRMPLGSNFSIEFHPIPSFLNDTYEPNDSSGAANLGDISNTNHIFRSLISPFTGGDSYDFYVHSSQNRVVDLHIQFDEKDAPCWWSIYTHSIGASYQSLPHRADGYVPDGWYTLSINQAWSRGWRNKSKYFAYTLNFTIAPPSELLPCELQGTVATDESDEDTHVTISGNVYGGFPIDFVEQNGTQYLVHVWHGATDRTCLNVSKMYYENLQVGISLKTCSTPENLTYYYYTAAGAPYCVIPQECDMVNSSLADIVDECLTMQNSSISCGPACYNRTVGILEWCYFYQELAHPYDFSDWCYQELVHPDTNSTEEPSSMAESSSMDTISIEEPSSMPESPSMDTISTEEPSSMPESEKEISTEEPSSMPSPSPIVSVSSASVLFPSTIVLVFLSGSRILF